MFHTQEDFWVAGPDTSMGCTLAWHICVKNGSPVAFAMSCNPMTSLGGTCVGVASVCSPVQLLCLHRRRGHVCIWETCFSAFLFLIIYILFHSSANTASLCLSWAAVFHWLYLTHFPKVRSQKGSIQTWRCTRSVDKGLVSLIPLTLGIQVSIFIH